MKTIVVATVLADFWATMEFWFFSLGLVIWLIPFLMLPRPVTKEYRNVNMEELTLFSVPFLRL